MPPVRPILDERSNQIDDGYIFQITEHNKKKEVQQFVPAHVFGHIISGSMVVEGAEQIQTFNAGDTFFFQRNQLGKFTKHPPANGGMYKSIIIIIVPLILQQFAFDYKIKAKECFTSKPFVTLEPDLLFSNYFNSLHPYFDPRKDIDPALQSLKIKEAILLLLQISPDVSDILFDFKQPGKIDLKVFMEKNYRFNVPITQFAQLTGRSVAAFKVDFQHIFGESPRKWLQQKRLDEAYLLLNEHGKKPSEIYLDLGFQDLSHFSYVFKKAFGISPSATQVRSKLKTGT